MGRLPFSLRVLASLGPALLLALASSGCGPGHGRVTGTVTYRGKPVVVGTVLIVGSDGIPAYGNVGEDGTYVIARVPTGAAQVAVNSLDPVVAARWKDRKAGLRGALLPPRVKDKKVVLPQPEPPPPGDRKGWFPIPEQYGNPRTSGLTCDVKRGANTCNLELH
jgi:hypothetical protein